MILWLEYSGKGNVLPATRHPGYFGDGN